MQWNRTQAELGWSASPVDGVDVRTVAYHHWLDRSWTKLNRFAGGPDLHDLLQEAPTTGQGAVYLDILRGEEDSTSPEQLLQIGTNARRFHAMGVQTTGRWEASGDAVGSSLEAGLRVHGDIVDRLHTEDPHAMTAGQLVRTEDPTLTLLDSRATALALAGHVHEDVRLGRWHLIPGVRVETVETAQEIVGGARSGPTRRTTVLPGGGALVSATSWLDLFAGAYRGFSPVAPGQAPDIQPELALNAEAGARLDTGDRKLEVVGFFVDYANLTGQCTLSGGCVEDQIDQQFNGGQARVVGVETVGSIDVMLPGVLTLPLSATYTYTDAYFMTGFVSAFPQFGTVEIADALPYVPRHQAGGRAGLSHPRVDASVGVAWRSAMLNEAGLFPETPEDIPELLLLDAAVRVQASPRLEVYAVGTNLLNAATITSWRPAGARPTAPLQVMGGLKFTPAPASGG